MKTLSDEIKTGKLFVSDGAWGTFLQKKGLQPGECPELWNIDHADKVLDIAESYITAGSDIIETNSFGANYFKLEHFGLADKTFELNKAAAEISRRAAGSNHYVVGSIGPTGKILMMGDVSENQLYEAFKVQAMGLAAGGADAIVAETMSDIDEARIAVRAISENTKCEAICTMTFNSDPAGNFFTMMGVTPLQMVEVLIEAGVKVIGSNCGNGIEGMIGVVKEIRAANTSIPIFIQANAGLPIYRDGETVFPDSPLQMANFVNELIHAGANIIGGCCGTTPEHIREIAKVVKK
jgi:5-methyltetrahydrofolate--homocysteine methyltransferase